MRFSRADFSVTPDGRRRRRGDSLTMSETTAERVAWRRRSLGQQYVGRLLVLPDRLRLVGRETSSGLDVTLSIPFGEIDGVRRADRAAERVLGEAGLVVELAGSDPIFLRELGSRGSRSLARLLATVVAPRSLAVSA
jgi:hypothetical protein